MAKINVMVENLSSDVNAELRTVLLEGVEVDMDKLMAVLTGKPMPRKPRTPKAKPAPVVETAPAPVEVKPEAPAPVAAPAPVEVKPETPKASKPRKGGFRRRSRSNNHITVSLVDCLGVGLYPTKKGPKAVAIYKMSKTHNYEILLWVDDNNETASHDDGGFPNTQGKLYNVEMF